MNVAGPYTTCTGRVRENSRQTGAAARTPRGWFPEMQPSRLSSFATSRVSSIPVSLPRARITIGSSPNLRCRSSVARAAAPSRSTKVEGDALVSSRSASSAPSNDSTTTTATTSGARRAEKEVSRPSTAPTSRLDQLLIRVEMRL